MSLIDSSCYNELPSLEEASVRRQVLSGMCSLNHGAQNTFALCLQHRHHCVGDDEAIVKVQGTAHLMNSGDIHDIEAIGNKIVPTTWMGTDMVPMEFAVIPSSAKIPGISAEFAADLVNVLALNGCEGLFGIDTLGEVDSTEFSIDNASVVVPSNGMENDKDYIPVAFAFDNQVPGFRVHARCNVSHTHSRKPPPK